MARNLRKFTIEAEYSAATLYYPSVSWVTGTDTVHYDKTAPTPPAPPVFEGKYKLTLSDSSTVSAACGGTSAITQAEISAYTASTVAAEIGDCVSIIGDLAFNSCYYLTSIDIPSGVTTIGDLAFHYCYSLPSITIPNSVTTIGDSAFFACISLASIDIPDSVTSISTRAFYSCTSLTSITVNATTPPTLSSNVFDDTNDCPIYVPSGSVNAYKSASGWSTYASRIQAIL